MSRTLSLTALASNNAEQTGEVWVFLLTITHEQLPAPLRYCSDPGARLSVDPLVYGTISRGDTFEYIPIGIVMPDDSDATPPAIKLTIDNVTRQAMPVLRSVSTPAAVTVELVLASDPDTVEASFPDFDLVNADYDSGSISIDLTIDSLVNEPYPAGTFTPSGFGGLF